MNPEYIKSLLKTAIDDIADSITVYSIHPKRDFTRAKKLPVNKLMLFLITEGSSSTKNELIDFFPLDDNLPSNSAFNQRFLSRRRLDFFVFQQALLCFR